MQAAGSILPFAVPVVLYVAGLPFLFGAVGWLIARALGARGGWPAFLWGFLLGPVGLGVVAAVFRPRT